jgi:hypothetical protein
MNCGAATPILCLFVVVVRRGVVDERGDVCWVLVQRLHGNATGWGVVHQLWSGVVLIAAFGLWMCPSRREREAAGQQSTMLCSMLMCGSCLSISAKAVFAYGRGG